MKTLGKKVYKITFNEYTNAMRDTVVYRKKPDELGDFVAVYNTGSFSEGSILVMEDQLIEIQKYGNGIKSAEFVGYLYNT